MNRLERHLQAPLGNDGWDERDQTRLIAFGAMYRFKGRSWCITIWARDWGEALRWAERHGLTQVGQIIERGEV